MCQPATPSDAGRQQSASNNEADESALLAPAVPNGGFAAWLRVAAYGLAGTSTLGMHYLFGALYVALLDDLEEPFPGALALVGSIAIAVFTNLAPLVAVLSGRFGARKTALLGAAIQGGGLALSACGSSAWALYGTFAIVGLGQSLAFFSAVLLMIEWFDTRLNRVHALANSLAATTTLFLGPPAHDVLAAIGWRSTLLCLALLTTTLLASAALVLTPPQSGRPKSRAGEPPVRWGTLLRSRIVLWLAACVLCYGLGGWLVVVHIVRLGLERGLSTAGASRLLLFVGLGNCSMRVPVGWAADRIGKLPAHASSTLLLSLLNLLCALPLPLARDAAFLGAYAFLAGGLIGGINSLNNGLAVGLLQLPQARVAVSLLMCPFGIGMMLGPVVAGALHDASGSYTLPLLYGAACLAASSSGVAVGAFCFRRQLAAARQAPAARIQPSGGIGKEAEPSPAHVELRTAHGPNEPATSTRV